MGAPPELTTPAERIRLLADLVPPLLALDGGAARLAEWTPRVGPVESPPQLRRRLRQTLAVYGDLVMSELVIDTLATIVPPPVREYAAAEVCFLLVGWDCRGWTTRLALRGSQLVVLSGAGRDAAALGVLLCHELVHAWHGRSFPDLPTITAPHEQLVYAAASERAWPALDQIPARERLVDAVALSWFAAARWTGDTPLPEALSL